jgi:hypothetical protein
MMEDSLSVLANWGNTTILGESEFLTIIETMNTMLGDPLFSSDRLTELVLQLAGIVVNGFDADDDMKLVNFFFVLDSINSALLGKLQMQLRPRQWEGNERHCSHLCRNRQ